MSTLQEQLAPLIISGVVGLITWLRANKANTKATHAEGLTATVAAQVETTQQHTETRLAGGGKTFEQLRAQNLEQAQAITANTSRIDRLEKDMERLSPDRVARIEARQDLLQHLLERIIVERSREGAANG